MGLATSLTKLLSVSLASHRQVCRVRFSMNDDDDDEEADADFDDEDSDNLIMLKFKFSLIYKFDLI